MTLFLCFFAIIAYCKLTTSRVFRIQNASFRIQNALFRIQNASFRIQNALFRIQNALFRIQKIKKSARVERSMMIGNLPRQTDVSYRFVAIDGFGNMSGFAEVFTVSMP
jgi:hypothetical protein